MSVIKPNLRSLSNFDEVARPQRSAAAPAGESAMHFAS